MEGWERKFKYEYESIMHYEDTAFGKPHGSITMEATDGRRIPRNRDITQVGVLHRHPERTLRRIKPLEITLPLKLSVLASQLL